MSQAKSNRRPDGKMVTMSDMLKSMLGSRWEFQGGKVFIESDGTVNMECGVFVPADDVLTVSASEYTH